LTIPIWGNAAFTPLKLVQTIPLPGVEGRIDHFALDFDGARLFVAALENSTVEVIDLKAGKRAQTINDLHEPQGILFIKELNKLIISNGEGGAVDILDGSSFERTNRIQFSNDADNLRYDASSKMVYVGYGTGGLGLIDLNTLKRAGDISLGKHPESFQLESSGCHIFVNLPPSRVAVIDKQAGKISSDWSLIPSALSFNYPMALDETHRRLFIGTRFPARLAVLDSQSGKMIARMKCVGDPDDVFYDERRKRIYISGGSGSIDVFEQSDPDHYRLLSNVATADGARTSFFSPESAHLYLAVPHQGKQQAEIRVYDVLP